MKKYTDTEIKKIIEEVVGNNDTTLKNTIYDIVKKIINLPFETDFTVAKLINYEPQKAFIDPLTQGQIINFIKSVCERINIKLESTNRMIGGLAYYNSFKKISMKNV